jgi:hypothetical protein
VISLALEIACGENRTVYDSLYLAAAIVYQFPFVTADDMSLVSAQDSLAWKTQGSLTDRTREHLEVEDEEVIELRQMLREQIERVWRGLDPIGVIGDPAKNQLSTSVFSTNGSVPTRREPR